jgi:hemoglobin
MEVTRNEATNVGARPDSLYDRLGEAKFHELARAFYRKAAADPVIGHMFPADLDAAAERQALFLIQFFGGPSIYSERRGHPRLRMRHLPFSIDRRARDAWVRRMTEALDEVGVPDAERADMLAYFERAATFLINREEGP